MVSRRGRIRRSSAFVACIGLVIATTRCDDDPARVTHPDVTLDQAWPNQDGLAWWFDVVIDGWFDGPPIETYPHPDSVPPLPPLDDLIAAFEAPITEPPDTTEAIVFALRFEGQGTTKSGVVGQNLVEVVEEPAVPRAAPNRTAARGGQGFLQRLASLRPDLAPRIHARLRDLSGAPDPRAPFFLHGGIFEKTAAYIGHYGDLDTLLSWQWLDRDLEPGAEFTHQLVPTLADDVFLHARVLRHLDVTVPTGTYAHCVQVFYAVDFGIAEWFSESEGSRYVRFIETGTIDFAPDVGPIRSRERQSIPPPSKPAPVTPSLIERRIEHRAPPAAE